MFETSLLIPDHCNSFLYVSFKLLENILFQRFTELIDEFIPVELNLVSERKQAAAIEPCR